MPEKLCETGGVGKTLGWTAEGPTIHSRVGLGRGMGCKAETPAPHEGLIGKGHDAGVGVEEDRGLRKHNVCFRWT